MSTAGVCLAVVSAILVNGCRKAPLDTEAAFNLIASQPPTEITSSFPSTLGAARLRRDKGIVLALESLVRTGYLSCRTPDDCRPGPKTVLRGGSGEPFEYSVGVYRLTDLLTLRMTSDDTAVAQARFEFEPAPFYAAHRELLVRMARLSRN